MAVATGSEHLAEARTAIAEVGPALVRLVRESAPDGPAVGRWRVGDVALHVCQAFGVDTDALAGRPLPHTALNPAAVAAMNDAVQAADRERDLDVLADRMERLLAEFLAVSAAPAGDEVTWLDGVRLPASAAACHLLEELLVHGYDMAAPAKRPWPIAPAHAALAVTGAVVPIVAAADPQAFVRPGRAEGFRARCDVRVRGHDRFTFVFDDGLKVEPPSSQPVDAHVAIDPVPLLLLLLRRMSRRQALVRGRAVVWGRRPWRLGRMMTMITPP